VNWRGTQASTSTMPVGSFAPNAWGIQDMLGNVWEWALDNFSEQFYLISPRRDPVNFDPEAMAPVIRGGSFRDSLEFCRPGFRINYVWSGNADSIGFRVTRHDP
jgi:sulfatase modifying factor 1